jgi:hypothetical protein
LGSALVNAHSKDTEANRQIRERREEATGIQATRRDENGPSIIVLKLALIIVIALSPQARWMTES